MEARFFGFSKKKKKTSVQGFIFTVRMISTEK